MFIHTLKFIALLSFFVSQAFGMRVCKPLLLNVDVVTWDAKDLSFESNLPPGDCFRSNQILNLNIKNDISFNTQEELIIYIKALFETQLKTDIKSDLSHLKRKSCRNLYGSNIEVPVFSINVFGIDEFGELELCKSFYRYDYKKKLNSPQPFI
jgi:hypothetical protein